MEPQAPPPQPQQEKKSLGPLAWVLIGCLGVVVLAVAIMVAGGFFVAKKVKGVSEDYQENPARTAAEMVVRTHPGFELIGSDDEAQTWTIRDKETGEVFTVDWSDLQQGKLGTKASESIAGGFGSLSTETDRFMATFPCPDADTVPSEYGLGALFGCIAGDAQTAKYFINAAPHSERVANTKVMWNDWYVDAGYGLHADKAEAEEMVRAAARLYAPAVEEKLIEIFRSAKDQTINANGFAFAYAYHRGPKIDGRTITITEQKR